MDDDYGGRTGLLPIGDPPGNLNDNCHFGWIVMMVITVLVIMDSSVAIWLYAPMATLLCPVIPVWCTHLSIHLSCPLLTG